MDNHHDPPPNIDSAKLNDSHLLTVVEAIRVCGRVHEPDQAMEIFSKFPSESTRTITISVLGRCHRHQQAMQLLESSLLGPPSAASYNAAIAACGKANDWSTALTLFEETMPPDYISTLTVNALLTVFANTKQGLNARNIYQKVCRGSDKAEDTSRPEVIPDSVTHHLVISALVRSGNLEEACTLLEELVREDNPNDTLFDLVATAYSRASTWEGVKRVETLRRRKVNGNTTTKGDRDGMDIDMYSQFHHWEGLEKVGSSWMVGTYTPLNLTVGIRPNRNPIQNGIQLNFFETIPNDEGSVDSVNNKKSQNRRKVGYLLMRNSNSAQPTSSLLGMFLHPTDRGQGLAKCCLAIWIWLCLQGSILPVTNIIRKPLLALILQHTFQFVPKPSNDGNDNGVLVELYRDPDDDDRVILYSSSLKSLSGAFSSRDLKNHKTALSSKKPRGIGRDVTLICALTPPTDLQHLQDICEEVLQPNNNGWKCNLTGDQIESIFLGRP
jgi:pentatricopeptide repeat protein